LYTWEIEIEMLEKEIVIGNPLGLHARPAARFVKLSQKLNADVYLEKDGERVNGKSILEIMMLAAEKGDSIKLIVDGEDEKKGIEILGNFLEGEDET